LRQSEQTQSFLKTVCEQVRWKQAHEAVRRDLADHIEDQADAYVRGGMNDSDAAERAVKEMGDPVDVGLMMDASYRPKVEFRLLIALGLLVLTGILVRAVFYRLTAAEWLKYAGALLMGVGCFVLMLRVNFYRMLHWAWYLEFAFLLLAVIIPLLGDWLSYKRSGPGFEYSCVQFLWLLYPVIYALIVYRLRGSNLFGLLAAGALFCIPLFLRATSFSAIGLYEVDAAAACFVIIMLAVFYQCFRGSRVIAAALTMLVTAFGTLLTAVSEPYRFARLYGVLYPSNDPSGDGWLTLRIRELLAKAVLFGQGGALSSQAQSFVAQNDSFTSDYVMTYLIYKYGYAAAIVLLLIIGTFLVFGFLRTKRIGSALGRLLAVGILMIFVMQTVLYIVPCVGYPFLSSSFFPFVTDGNLVLIVDFLLAGLLASLFRTDTLFADTPPHRWKRLRIRISMNAELTEPKPR